MAKAKSRIGIALSGGGVRAMAFHSGVFRSLASRKHLEKIHHVSSVSGGSLFTGLVFHLSGHKWPTSAEYLENTFPEIQNILTNQSLQGHAMKQLLVNPFNWRFILSRANIIAKSIESLWKVRGGLGDLPSQPVWSINCTTGETGRRFRFKASEFGDYEIGYAKEPKFKLSQAMAISAAFPVGIGPMTIDPRKYEWYKRPYWGAPSTDPIEVKYKSLHLYDGGLYDNLGMETLFDIGTQKIKKGKDTPDIDLVILSDAGAAFDRADVPGPFSISRMRRLMDVATDQARALRIRSFLNFLKQKPNSAVYIQAGTIPLSYVETFSFKKAIAKRIQEHTWLSSEDIASAALYPTSLARMDLESFQRLEQHGFETTELNQMAFGAL